MDRRITKGFTSLIVSELCDLWVRNACEFLRLIKSLCQN